MTIHGMGGCRFVYGDTAARRTQEAYVSITRFLTSSFAQSIGIQRIAYNTGSGATGQNYWDQNNPIGNNAWSVYTFLSASTPFQMLVQMANATTFGASPGNPGLAEGVTTVPSIGFAFGARADGSSSWGGTTLNNGNDVKGNVVWASGSSTLFVWPRSNTGGGTHAANKHNTVVYTLGFDHAYGSRLNVVADENNILFMHDQNDYLARILYFGKYNVRSGTVAQAPYVMLRGTTNTDPALALLTNVFGSTAGNATLEGACAHPQPPSGSQTTMICGVTFLNDQVSTTAQPNLLVSSSWRFDEYPIHIALYESTYYGYVGYIDWIRFVFGVPPYGVSATGDRLFVGGQVAVNTTRLSVPWTGSIGSPAAGVGVTPIAAREGTFF